MIRTASLLTALGLVLLAGTPAAGQPTFKSAQHDFRVVTVADGLVNPWAMAWLPGGDMLITERPGRLRIVRDGSLLPDPVPGIPDVFARGQGGLFDVLPHPDFASNRWLYLSYARPMGEGSTTAVIRGRFENDRFTDIEEIFEAVRSRLGAERVGHGGAFYQLVIPRRSRRLPGAPKGWSWNEPDRDRDTPPGGDSADRCGGGL